VGFARDDAVCDATGGGLCTAGNYIKIQKSNLKSQILMTLEKPLRLKKNLTHQEISDQAN